jgi:hypothetical protein
MRTLLVLCLLVASAPGCCTPPPTQCVSGSCLTPCGPSYAAYRTYAPGYQRPCYPAYRPIDSAAAVP